MECLPAELKQHIMLYLDHKDWRTMMMVCKAWCYMALPLLYETLDFRTMAQLGKWTHASQLGHTFVTTLTVVRIPCVTDSFVQELVEYSHPKLSTLNLANCKGLSPASIGKLLLHAQDSLEVVNLASCTLSQHILDVIGNMGGRRLHFVDISSCTVNPNSSTSTITFPQDPGNIKELNLSHCAWITPDTVQSIAVCMPKLEYLCLSLCDKLLISTIHALIPKLRHLQAIDLRYLPCVTPDQAQAMLHSNRHVRRIQCTGRSDPESIIQTFTLENDLTAG